ncbi:uncharacterized protein LOC114366779 isoform X2 [Ostrinia furnacalis]|uniref:Odorant binding protein 7 n=1 Tax=Ostrinia furnacalis TaxID=93504 RepID=A0A1B4ZBI9_OSTFU|nr:uncharacterized protein LOC114366779 isoform X2 [Ostrinia furnacalis]BAV56794.1 odorant binding protein 7 [Ostrinia furnacalis]
MVGFVVVALVAVFQVISCQEPPPFLANVPEQCRRPPEGVDRPHTCCKIPSFFKDEDLQECGFKKLEDEPERPGPPHGPPDCSKQLCVMKKYNLLKGESDVDHDATKEYLQKWIESNPEWKEPMDAAIERCIGQPLPGPPHICEANKMVVCISFHLFGKCVSWSDTEGCKKLKAHMDECAQYFPKH